MPVIPHGLHGAAFLFWGLATGEWMFAAFGIILLELPQLLGWKRDISFSSYRRSWLITILSMWALVIFGALEFHHSESIRFILKWTPFALLALPLTSVCSNQRTIPVTVFFVLLQKSFAARTSPGISPRIPAIDPGYPYLCILLLGAAYQNPPTFWFFPIATFLLIWPFVRQAHKRGRRLIAVITTLILVATAAHGMHIGISWLHASFEDHFFRGRSTGSSDHSQSQTQIGNISETKLSHNIRWRAKLLNGPSPNYLREASFDRLSTDHATIWRVSNPDQHASTTSNSTTSQPAPLWRISNPGQHAFRPLKAEDDDAINPTLWPLTETAIGNSRLQLRGRADEKWTILPLPDGAQLIADLPALAVHHNGFATLRVDSAYPLISCIITSGQQLPNNPHPHHDLTIPDELKETLAPIVDELRLLHLTPQEAVRRIEHFFANDFTYTLDRTGASISSFILNEKSGHCEYYATATTVLLRMANIPARYNIGFYLKEYDTASQQFLLRGSHAHAWATAWIDGKWQIVDTTPADWFAIDTAGAPNWQGLHDWWGEMSLRIMEWRSQADPFAILANHVPTIAFLLFLYILIRLYLMQRKRSPTHTGIDPSFLPPKSFHSPWLDILPHMEKRLGKRPDHLPSQSWVRSHPLLPETTRTHALTLIADHNQRRFGPTHNPKHIDPNLANPSSRLKEFLQSPDTTHQ